MIRTDGTPTIAWAPIIDSDPGDETTHHPTPRPHKIALSDEELHIITEALDSHAYWQLSDPTYRNDAAVIPPGSDDPNVAREIADVNALFDRLIEVAQR